jgi:hypothetical protein
VRALFTKSRRATRVGDPPKLLTRASLVSLLPPSSAEPFARF